jgi:hypothetical protein
MEREPTITVEVRGAAGGPQEIPDETFYAVVCLQDLGDEPPYWDIDGPDTYVELADAEAECRRILEDGTPALVVTVTIPPVTVSGMEVKPDGT